MPREGSSADLEVANEGLRDSMVLRSLSSPEIVNRSDGKLQPQNVITTHVINLAPQDYINVDGATYRVNRVSSPRGLPTETPSGSLLCEGVRDSISTRRSLSQDASDLELTSSGKLSRQSSSDSLNLSKPPSRSASFCSDPSDSNTLAIALAGEQFSYPCVFFSLQGGFILSENHGGTK